MLVLAFRENHCFVLVIEVISEAFSGLESTYWCYIRGGGSVGRRELMSLKGT